MLEIMRRTLKQNRIIHQLISRRGISSEKKTALVEQVSGGRVNSSAQLTKTEANDLITKLGGDPPQPNPQHKKRALQRKRQRAGIKQIVTQRQVIYIEDLWKKFGRTDKGLQKLCQNIIRKNYPRTTAEANKIIEAIKSMNERKKK